MARLGWLQGLFSRYGKDAFEAATFSRQIPRFNKPVEMPGLPAWTGVQLPPPPKKPEFKKRIRAFFLFNTYYNVEPRGMSAEKVFLRSIGIGGDRLTTSKNMSIRLLHYTLNQPETKKINIQMNYAFQIIKSFDRISVFIAIKPMTAISMKLAVRNCNVSSISTKTWNN